MLCGGASNTEVNDKIKTLVGQVKSEVEKQTNESYSTFEPVEAMQQVVRSTLDRIIYRLLEWTTSLRWILEAEGLFLWECKRYLIDITYSYDHFGDVSLSSVQANKSIDDPLAYF